MACALEEYGACGHPVGNAIFSAGVQQLGESWSEFKKFGSVRAANKSESGGLSGHVSLSGDDEKYHLIVLGSKRYLEGHQVACWKREGPPEDESAIFVHAAVDGIYAGTFSLIVSRICAVCAFIFWIADAATVIKDGIRAEAVTSLQKLKGMGYSCGMVSITWRPHPFLLAIISLTR